MSRYPNYPCPPPVNTYPAGPYLPTVNAYPAGLYLPTVNAYPAGPYHPTVKSTGTAGTVFPPPAVDNPGNSNRTRSKKQNQRLDKIQKVSGYENITNKTTILSPPISSDLPEGPSERQHTEQSRAGISEEEAREAAIDYVSKQCCYGKDPVKTMVIRNIEMSSGFHYILETFAEKREAKWAYSPYNGEVVYSPLMGIAPAPWDIPLVPKRQFSDSVQKMEVPHTASVISCRECKETGVKNCIECIGGGEVECFHCKGKGVDLLDSQCRNCKGKGKTRCNKCDGTGKTQCTTCNGKGMEKCYVELTVTWTNHIDDFIVECTKLPDKLIRNVTGNIAFEETSPRVWPINHFQSNINNASKRLVNKHKQEFPLELILQQRHKVRIIPVAEINYTWRDKGGEFFVYGFENEVYFPDYPQSCCWSCNVL